VGLPLLTGGADASIHLGLGEIDQVFTCLDHAIDDRDSVIVPIKTNPSSIRFASTPRFAALQRKMNLES
jgi:hypothetical protein